MRTSFRFDRFEDLNKEPKTRVFPKDTKKRKTQKTSRKESSSLEGQQRLSNKWSQLYSVQVLFLKNDSTVCKVVVATTLSSTDVPMFFRMRLSKPMTKQKPFLTTGNRNVWQQCGFRQEIESWKKGFTRTKHKNSNIADYSRKKNA